MPRRPHRLLLLRLAGILTIASLVSCLRHVATPPASSQGVATTMAPALGQAEATDVVPGSGQADPAAYSNIRPADYIGPEACGECHLKNYKRWRQHLTAR